MKFQYFRDKKKEWRWRLVGRNGKIIADCAEGYKTRRACLKAIEKIKEISYDTPVIEMSEVK